MPLYKFTPDLMSYEELERLSVGREALVSEVLRRIADHAKKRIPAYLLIVGPRGIGKSHFLLRVYHKIKNDRRLNKLVQPIKLSEEEYSVYRLSDLFLRILEEEGVKDFSVKEEELIIERGVHYLKELKKRKMPLLFMDNVHLIFSQLAAEDLKRFRSILQEENFLLILGTASSIFTEIADYDGPFYDFFEIRFLKDLSEEEVEELTKKKLEFEGKEDLLKEFDKLKPRIEAISILTGGNPRLILMICDLLCRPEKLADIEKSLFGLLDELTPFYQARMETFPSQQRMIFDTLALAEGPLPPTEIAKKARIGVNVVNVQLKRLEEAGYVEPIKLRRKKITPYEIKERLFRIWREMRSPLGSKRIRLFVRFLKLWYLPQELIEVYNELVESMDRAIRSKLFDETRRLAIHACYLQEAVGPPVKYRMFLGWVSRLTEDLGDFATAEKEISDRKAIAERMNDKEAMSMALVAEVIMHEIKRELTKAIEIARAAIDISPSNPYAWSTLGSALSEAGQYDEALKCMDQSIKKSKTIPEKHDTYFNKSFLLQKLSKYQDALEAVEESIKTIPECGMAWDLKAWILANLEKTQEALHCSDKALELDPNLAEPWYTRAFVFYLLNDKEMEMESIDKFLKIEPDNEFVLNRKAHLLLEIGRRKESLENFQRSLEIAKAKNNLDIAASSAFHILGENLFQSRQSVVNGDFEKAQKSLEKALDATVYIQGLDEYTELFKNVFLKYLVNISQNGAWEFIDRTLEVVNEKLSGDYVEHFSPFFKAIEYVKTKDPDILESLQKEVRDVVLSIIKTIAPNTPIPKDLK